MEFLSTISSFVSAHYQWFFSGLGVFIIGLFFMKKQKSQSMKQGKHSTGYQAGGNINVINRIEHDNNK